MIFIKKVVRYVFKIIDLPIIQRADIDAITEFFKQKCFLYCFRLDESSISFLY